MEFDHSVGISLSRIRCTTLSAGALLYAWSWAGLRAPRQFPLSACFGPPARKGDPTSRLSYGCVCALNWPAPAVQATSTNGAGHFSGARPPLTPLIRHSMRRRSVDKAT